MVSSKGIEIDPSKVKAICDLRPPTTTREVRSLMGRLNYVARFICQLSETAKPFFKLLKKNAKIEWDVECQNAFEKIKHYLTHAPVLVPPLPKIPLILYLTIHDESLGAMLAQKIPNDKRECAIYYLSYGNTRFITESSVTENDPIRYLLEKPALVGKLAKWQILISEFNVQSLGQKSVKGRAIADMLAESSKGSGAFDEDSDAEERILLVSSDTWTMYFDGAVNLAGSGTGAVLISPDGQHYPVAAKLTFPCTNNIVEYEACILGLQAAIDMKIRKLQVYGDSTLIILQTEGSADALATLSSMLQVAGGLDIEPLRIEILRRPAYCMTVEEEPDGQPWYHDILKYLQKGEFPEGSEAADRKHLLKLASKFFTSGDVLYKKAFDSTLLRCVDAKEANCLMKEIHEGECGPHMNGHLLARKIMRLGYYWLTMESDCIQHVRFLPFSMWGIDVIGPINPKASNGHRFILVAIDYFTKWIEANSYANVTAKNVAKFIRRDIIARYGVPEAIITDNGSNLNNKVVNDLLDEFRVHHLNSSPYRPQMNGAVEAANKNIKKILAKTAENYRDWHERLPYALMAY
ncbi:uncharacterized protein LOC120292553 [Eucalyptus grandis]|uniref:uncharacterized protein LOC120292553 n=1 Tax=Eucalyptus grandis TaxID=71139 RepID=UPI00192EAEFE|nr:uncharacterized protein LOC120292553 [Eucalyptus grandis]